LKKRRVNVSKRLGITGWLALSLLLLAQSGAPAATEQFLNDVRSLTAAPHRLGGTEEYGRAADYVQQRLTDLGLDEVFVQEFPSAQTKVLRCEAVAPGGRVIPLVPDRPNGIIPPVSGPEGITGELVYVGTGTQEDFQRANPSGKIAVMDYNSGDQFLQVFRLGAKAIIFVRQEPALAWNHHYVNANANLPRYFHDGRAEDLPLGETITIHSEIVWERVTGRNVIAYIKGTNPVFNFDKPEVLILAANLDTFGDVPRRSPGARGAANCAALLQLAEQFKKNPPRRDVLFLFTDMSARLHAGAAAFYSALEEDDKRSDINARLEYWQQETAFLTNMNVLIQSSDPLSQSTTPHGRDLVKRLRTKAADYAYLARGTIMELREELDALKNTEGDHAERIAQLEEEIAIGDVDKDRWNDLRRYLGKGETAPEVKDLFTQVLDAVHRDAEIRTRELKVDESMLKSAKRIKNLLGDKWISLHMTLLLGDTTDRWGVIVGGNSEIHSPQDNPGLYGKIKTIFQQAWRDFDAAGETPRLFDTYSVGETLAESRLLWAVPMLVHSGEIAGRFGLYNIVLGTIQERLAREGTPDDTMELINIDAIENAAGEIALMLGGIRDGKRTPNALGVADQEALSMRRSIRTDKQFITSYFANGRPQGALCMGRQRGSSMPNMAVPGATVQLFSHLPWNNIFWPYSKAYGFDQFYVVMSDQNGTYSCGPLPEGDGNVVGFSAAFDGKGNVKLASDNESTKQALTRLNMFNAADGLFMLPPGFWQDPARVMNARANATISDDTGTKAYTETTDGVILFFCEDRIPGIKAFELGTIAALAYTPDKKTKARDEQYGVGFPLDTDWTTIRTAKQSVYDIWNLNESRLAIMRSRDIMNSSLEELHGRIQDTLNEAEKIDSPARQEAMFAASFMSARPVYTMIRESMDDLVTAVLILLALCVPFAFALERLLIGASMIYKQVMWFTIFFILTFVILYLSHPAFAIAQTPIIIFLGFAVVVLSTLVIVIIMRKFQLELKAIQGMTASVHASDISRFNTVMAAMSMGISTMRRRPLRTALTAITIILLTFTILCFASFDTQKGIIKLFTAPSPPYTGVLLRNATYGSYNPDYLDIIDARWGADAIVCPRYWVCPEFKNDPDFVVSLEDGSNSVTLRGILGLDAKELAQREDLRELLQIQNPDDIADKVFITEAVADLIKAKPGDRVIIQGLRLTVGPLLQSSKFSIARDMDGSSVLPVDFLAMKDAGADVKQASGDATDDQAKWSSLPVDSIVIMSSANALLNYGKCHCIPIYTEDSQQASEIAEDAARMRDKTPIIATRKDGVYRHILGTVVAASGVGDLLFPVLLGGLVIFGTMLGSVADREKEIYTFSALGLAPPHVASLFFAEAMVYSVIGGLGGYLIAQGSMKILGFLATYGWVQVPEMNYSSTNAIVTILIVMATVLVSAIYPAVKASKSANPGLLRSWKLPQPEGDVIDLVFPFTVSEYDLTGVVSFLKEHFEAFSDTGLGSFMAQKTKLIVQESGSLGVATRLAIAPFDLGVTQDIFLKSAPSEIPGIDEVNIRLTRRSGQPKDWARLNKVLLNDLRTQFLLWRSLPAETMEIYRQRTLAQIHEMKQDPA